MNKRGQIYILVALVLTIVIFGLVTVTNKAQQESVESNFEKLSDNYASESARFVNSLLASDEEKLTESFTQFTQLFTAYSKTQSPNFGLIYVFNYNDKLYVGNYLKKEISVLSGCNDAGENLCSVPGCYEEISANVGFDDLDVKVLVDNEELKACTSELDSNNFGGDVPLSVELDIDDVPYTFILKKNHPEIIMVSWEEMGEQRKVYTSGELDDGSGFEEKGVAEDQKAAAKMMTNPEAKDLGGKTKKGF